LLEGASVTGARGVIINVTGGPDLSLVEVSEASSIVQEAADEDANIIFGAVVDPTLKGKVKITVIATGFGPPMSIKPSAQTPIDMTQYTDYPRIRPDTGGTAAGAASFERAAGSRLAIARRPLLDIPAGPSSASSLPGAEMSAAVAAESMPGDPLSGTRSDDHPMKFDLADDSVDAAEFEVPAFLRRQES